MGNCIPHSLVVFCGGSGVHHFGSMLAKRFPRITFLVNAYDDGKSTGRIRNHLDCLGPSDPAKLIAMLARDGEIPALSDLLQLRLPIEGNATHLRRMLYDAIHLPELPFHIFMELERAINAFLTVTKQGEHQKGQPFDFRDLAVRNALLVGCAHLHGGYQRAIDYLTELFKLPADIVVVSEEIAYLVAVLEDGHILTTEAEICDRPPGPPIWRIHLLHHQLSRQEAATIEQIGDPTSTSHALESAFSARVEATQRAKMAVRQAQGILYAPGTFFSSIVPSAMLLTPELASLEVPRLWIANLVQECEPLTVAGLMNAFWHNVTRAHARTPISRWHLEPFVSHVLVEQNHPDGPPGERGDALPIAREQLYALVEVEEQPLQDQQQPGVHSHEKLLDALSTVLLKANIQTSLREVEECI
ncbi:hypothetical protein KSF_050330 [Reticulibacter mediterranei]|uniref:GAK system CofD-like protein n=1 Tax=Reticulibacter mediterranei TaxID=2778369 RepID=A0A8J3IM61_9CHLR|nr:2-phospho-L-lactate transferase CofD family protein [Reticulibacter mediterranei]GHO94985.1 hypothetical protein KSF_050330 [Reticulibacter mediterranei]